MSPAIDASGPSPLRLSLRLSFFAFSGGGPRHREGFRTDHHCRQLPDLRHGEILIKLPDRDGVDGRKDLVEAAQSAGARDLQHESVGAVAGHVEPGLISYFGLQP